MITVDTRPQLIGTVSPFRQNSLTLTVVIDDQIEFSEQDIKIELWNNVNTKIYDIEQFAIEGQTLILNFTRLQVSNMPDIAICRVILFGNHAYGYKIVPEYGFGTPINTTATIALNLKGDKGDPGDLTVEAQELKDLMTQDRESTAADRAAVNADTIAVEAGRAATEGYRDEVINLKTDVTTLKSETNQIKSDTNTIKTDTIAIRDEAMAIVANPRPATYAAMVALLRLNHPKTFTVQNDEFQGIQKVPYYWDGVELYVYGTLVDPQPTVTQ